MFQALGRALRGLVAPPDPPAVETDEAPAPTKAEPVIPAVAGEVFARARAASPASPASPAEPAEPSLAEVLGEFLVRWIELDPEGAAAWVNVARLREADAARGITVEQRTQFAIAEVSRVLHRYTAESRTRQAAVSNGHAPAARLGAPYPNS